MVHKELAYNTATSEGYDPSQTNTLSQETFCWCTNATARITVFLLSLNEHGYGAQSLGLYITIIFEVDESNNNFFRLVD